MSKPIIVGALTVCLLMGSGISRPSSDPAYFEISRSRLADKIHGGLLGQLLGNLNGLAHENKYYEEPGHVETYIPALPQGARTDDDTDIEWVYITAMQKQNKLLLDGAEITALWKRHINSHIWCANLYTRQLMHLGVEPPLTGALPVNPWADFNISGQFVCESFGLIAPAMPQTAAQVGLNYTHVTIDGEPAQATQMFTAMIATAFVTDDINAIIDAGAAALDPASELVQIVTDVRRWWRDNPADWRVSRRRLRDKYMIHSSRMRNQNGYELCTGATIAALLYGNGDLVQTLTTAFNFGWDADNNAATAGTIVGVIQGHDWIAAQGWRIEDIYRNTTRPGMPEDETITEFAERLTAVADIAIMHNGGRKLLVNGEPTYRIRRQSSANVEKLNRAPMQRRLLWSEQGVRITTELASSDEPHKQARAAYLAICLRMAERLKQRHPTAWTAALAELQKERDLLEVLYDRSPGRAGDRLRAAATAAGLKRP